MNIAVLSGKGGTGKTFVAVNLASVAHGATYIDCDVEEPNGHLFFNPQNIQTEDVLIKVPVVDDTLCKVCRSCVDFCKFNALALINNKLMIFDEICHSCGGCALVCPNDALSEHDRVIGKIQQGVSNTVMVLSGFLNVGESSGVPIIKKLLATVPQRKDTFIDCPPGSACTVMESIVDADYCLFVVEPTLFGVHNFKMVYELVNLFEKPHGVILNKCLETENPARFFCLENNIKILGEIPYDNNLATINSNGMIVANENTKYRRIFGSIQSTLTEEVKREAVTHS